jgi:DNA-binding transcriptional ArsR family regulator
MTIKSDPVWRALASRRRRAILAALRDGPKSTTYLVEQFPEMSRFAVIKHITVLREVGLVRTREKGRQKINSLNAVPLRLLYEELVNDYQDLWARQMLNVKRHAENG